MNKCIICFDNKYVHKYCYTCKDCYFHTKCRIKYNKKICPICQTEFSIPITRNTTFIKRKTKFIFDINNYLSIIKKLETRNERSKIVRKLYNYIVEHKDIFLRYPQFMKVVRKKLYELKKSNWKHSNYFFLKLFDNFIQ